MLRQLVADELEADQVDGRSLQVGGFRSGMAPLRHQTIAIPHPSHREHVGGEVKTDQSGTRLSTLIGTVVQPARQRLGTDAHGTAQIQHTLQPTAQQRLHCGVDGISQLRLGSGGRQLLVWPDPQGHRIGGLLRLRRGLPAEVALLVGVKTGQVIVGWLHPRAGAVRHQRLRSDAQVLPTLAPGNAVAFRRADDQLPRLEEQRSPQHTNADQALDQTPETAAGISPAWRGIGVGH